MTYTNGQYCIDMAGCAIWGLVFGGCLLYHTSLCLYRVCSWLLRLIASLCR